VNTKSTLCSQLALGIKIDNSTMVSDGASDGGSFMASWGRRAGRGLGGTEGVGSLKRGWSGSRATVCGSEESAGVLVSLAVLCVSSEARRDV
jgi:hypothetical protein